MAMPDRQPTENERLQGYQDYIQCRATWTGKRTSEPMSWLQWNLDKYHSPPPPDEFIDDHTNG